MKKLFIVVMISIFTLACATGRGFRSPVAQVYKVTCQEQESDLVAKEEEVRIRIWGAIDMCTSYWFQVYSQRFFEQKFSRLVLEISSPGGSYYDTLAIVDRILQLKKLGVKVITIGFGQVHSGATLIFLLGDERYINPTTKMFFHPVQARGGDKKIKERLERLQKDMENFLEKLTGIPGKELMNKELFYEEIISLGIAQPWEPTAP